VYILLICLLSFIQVSKFIMEVIKSENTSSEKMPTNDQELIPSKNEKENEVLNEKSGLNLEEVSSESPEESKEEDENAEKNDPYAYLNRDEFSSENFKIEIQNLPKYFGVGVRISLISITGCKLC